MVTLGFVFKVKYSTEMIYTNKYIRETHVNKPEFRLYMSSRNANVKFQTKDGSKESGSSKNM